MKTIILTYFFILFSSVSNAQYPFEKFKAIKYKEYKEWKTIDSPKDSLPMFRKILIPEFDTKRINLKIEQTFVYSLLDSTKNSMLKIYRNNRIVSKFKASIQDISEPLPVYVGDIDGDGLKDLKIIFPHYGCGAYNVYCRTVLLFQNKDNTFKEIVFTDVFENFVNRPERDLITTVNMK